MTAAEPYELHHGDVLDILPTLEAESFDAMLTDPPYGLEFMGRDWDRVVPGPTVWREALRVLKPGAFALVFGGTRTFHRLAVALEDAGFEIRDTLMYLYGNGFPKSHNLTGEWEGYGTALKPAWEPVLLVRKPSPLTFAENALQHGAGAVNIDGCRVQTDERITSFGVGKKSSGGIMNYTDELREPYVQSDLGRWPANLIHDGSEEVLQRFPDAPGQQRPISTDPTRRKTQNVYGEMVAGRPGEASADDPNGGAVGFNMRPGDRRLDSGSAARFFYTAKANSEERDAGLHHLPRRQGGMTSETSGQHITRRDPGYEIPKVANHHPTVKPIALTEYLAKLLLPPQRESPRRILVPFAGSGSEIIGALRAGWDEAVGIEREAEYVTIADARIAHWIRGIQPRLLEAVS